MYISTKNLMLTRFGKNFSKDSANISWRRRDKESYNLMKKNKQIKNKKRAKQKF